MVNEISDNNLIQSFYNLIPYFKNYFDSELIFTISNTEKFLFVQDSENLKMASKTGDKVPKGCAADICLKEKKPISAVIPEEVFGVSLKTNAVPVFENNEIVGTMVIGMSLEKKKKVSSMVNSISESISQINDNLLNMSSGLQKISETNLDIQKFVKETNESSKETDEVLKFIQGVAKQTNLLGLNAAIESARAGEYGKGFSVVSNEIRRLSDSSRESINQINNILNTMQNSISEIYERFNGSNEILNKETAGMQQISAAVEELNSTATVLKDFADKL
ncbi:methyl-accepting chemotaxis protein [Clostridium sp. P21]|uniref:Methyl-accepting chemotaxis protein n=1 Tax=Clostridium muellerianum TaxID=2716538 RepID=A0A7Y0HRA9_9CLOT|nr:methyl-accepting chemotaxis protein [Clostridium muellerianum]NMM65011.1 methyl-accepting chemotaxis protein [Clostridium muellerianum]